MEKFFKIIILSFSIFALTSYNHCICNQIPLISKNDLIHTNYYLISFPRSGQHMTERFLSYFYEFIGLNHQYCEYYTCCKKTPCIHNSNLQKNHDFNLDFPIDNKSKYIVLIRRDKFMQFEAFYRWSKYADTPNNSFSVTDYRKSFNIGDFKIFTSLYKQYYEEFINKWTKKRNNILVIYYEDIQKNPAHSFFSMINFFHSNTTSIELIRKLLLKRTEKINKPDPLHRMFLLKIYCKLGEPICSFFETTHPSLEF